MTVEQRGLFDEEEETVVAPVVALQTWRLTLPCAYGRRAFYHTPARAVGWFGDHHCDACCGDVLDNCEKFAADVRAGKYDEYGFTPAERRALVKRDPNWRPHLRLI